jgi:ABC-type uncharacterized transport system fused permease/ATPase subunit
VSGSLAGAVYYLPQKPYQVLGTLFDQISYPAESSDGLTRCVFFVLEKRDRNAHEE